MLTRIRAHRWRCAIGITKAPTRYHLDPRRVFGRHHARAKHAGVLGGPMEDSFPRRRTQTSPRATGRLGAFFSISTLTIAVALAAPSPAAAAAPVASAGWHGRAIQDAQPQTHAAGTPGGLPRDWAAGPVRLGTGFHRDGGSLRVRETQRRLWRLGYRPGPVDGLFGPRTQAAVQWFQIKHGLAPDGVVGPMTLSALRDTGGAGHQAARGERLGVRAPARP